MALYHSSGLSHTMHAGDRALRNGMEQRADMRLLPVSGYLI